MIVFTAGTHLSTTGGSSSQSDKSDYDVNGNAEISLSCIDPSSYYSHLSLYVMKLGCLVKSEAIPGKATEI